MALVQLLVEFTPHALLLLLPERTIMKHIKNLNTLANLTYDLAALAGLMESMPEGMNIFSQTEVENILITLERGMAATAWAAQNLPDIDVKNPEGKVFMRTLLLRAVQNIESSLNS